MNLDLLERRLRDDGILYKRITRHRRGEEEEFLVQMLGRGGGGVLREESGGV